jgi:hypothetical protein
VVAWICAQRGARATDSDNALTRPANPPDQITNGTRLPKKSHACDAGIVSGWLLSNRVFDPNQIQGAPV